jgi:hypothetical protein
MKEAAGLTLISDVGVHTKCTTTGILFGHPLSGYNPIFFKRIVGNHNVSNEILHSSL